MTTPKNNPPDHIQPAFGPAVSLPAGFPPLVIDLAEPDPASVPPAGDRWPGHLFMADAAPPARAPLGALMFGSVFGLLGNDAADAAQDFPHLNRWQPRAALPPVPPVPEVDEYLPPSPLQLAAYVAASVAAVIALSAVLAYLPRVLP